ncbi:peptide transporter family 1-like isoform X2 [Trichoplusia ni]|uniref:Oligopeptide transporter 1 n=1 Tax=Trichoplusia ni TaxID=7111 RepID=A0A7E5VI62_TRINI|nr:peptide transporter family 1-like isoform X2 [Trichoplusia ni]
MEAKPRNLPYPKAVGFIVTNEFCERFSYYGMRTILSLYLRGKLGYTDNGATVIYHIFSMFAYFFPLLGAMIADGWLGRYRTILYLSLVYASGSSLISISAMPQLNLPTMQLTILALLLIAFGTGGIKPCVSAFGGDQFRLPEQERYLGYFFSMFYFAINAGSLISTFLTPILRADVHCFGSNDCYPLAFGVPGILMVSSIVVFVAGKRLYIIKKPAGNVLGRVATCIGYATVKSFKSKDKREHWMDRADDKYDKNLIEDVKSLLRVLVLFIPLPLFWALFDQQGSRWTFQADRMKQDIGSWTLKADQMQVLNPLLILLFIPLFEVAIYPFLTWCKLIRKPLHKMIWGGMLAAFAFIISGIVELSLLPSYGTPVAEGFAQLRVYNGFNCKFTLSTANLNALDVNATVNVEIGPLSAYEKLDIIADRVVETPYYLQGESNTQCADIAYSGYFNLKEKTANSFFISKKGINNFTDNNDKAIGGVNVRFLTNVNDVVHIRIEDKKNRDVLSIRSNNSTQMKIPKGVTNVYIDGNVVLKDFHFKSGACYTINVYEDVLGTYTANAVMITPANSVHILWLVPQYVVMTMGEVMFSVTGLEFSFTQAPVSMKSVLQSVWLLTVAFGNLIVVLIVEGNFLDAQWKEFFLFAGLMIIDMLIFTMMAFRYQYRNLDSSDENLTAAEMKQPEKAPPSPALTQGPTQGSAQGPTQGSAQGSTQGSTQAPTQAAEQTSSNKN